MELGNLIKKFTTSIGIKPCKGCEQRAEALNRFGRRGLIRGSLSALAAALLWPVRAFSQGNCCQCVVGCG